ncbi:MAG: 6-bladed beta-propeller [Prevotellaceae bacterium]|jgi:hypothetical protein|nr:6-bladed beta-propeller [Prevotellaceae bacterium]
MKKKILYGTMRNFSTVFFIVLVFACSTKRQADTDLKDVKIYNIDPLEGKFFQWNDFIDKIKFIQLETTEKSLIGQLHKGIIDEDDIYIFDRRFHKLLNFDTTGKYIRNIGSRGGGPGEFLEMRDVCISKSNVYTLDYQKIHSYDRKNGVYLESWRLANTSEEFNPSNFFIYDKNSYFLWCSNPDARETDGKFYRMRMAYQGKIKSEYFKYEYPTSEDPRFYPCSDNSVYIMPVDGEYVIYKLTNDSVYASFAINFGKYAISPQKADILRKSKEQNAYLKSDFYKRILKVLETNDYIYFTCIGPKSYPYEGLINKKTEEITFGKQDHTKSPRFFFSDSVFLYGYYEPHTLIERKNNGTDLNICFDVVFDSLNNISIDENPVLVKVLLK